MLTHNVTSHWHKMMCAYIYRHVQYLICSVNKLITADFTCWLNPIINWVAAASSKGQNSKYLWKSSAPNSRWKNLKWLMNKLWVDYDTIFTESVCVCVSKDWPTFLTDCTLVALFAASPDASASPPRWDPSLWRDKRHAQEFKLLVNLSGVAETFSD